jgi:hypothetical protein
MLAKVNAGSGGDSKPQTIIAMELQPLPYL